MGSIPSYDTIWHVRAHRTGGTCLHEQKPKSPQDSEPEMIQNQRRELDVKITELQTSLMAQYSKKENQFEIEKSQINLKLEMEKNRAELCENNLKRCEDELLRTKLSLQNQIEKDESYYRDEISKLKADFKMELKAKAMGPMGLRERLLAGRP